MDSEMSIGMIPSSDIESGRGFIARNDLMQCKAMREDNGTRGFIHGVKKASLQYNAKHVDASRNENGCAYKSASKLVKAIHMSSGICDPCMINKG